jgi:hypothetical protein
MGSGPRHIDYGPMSLAVGAQSPSAIPAAVDAQRESDALRLRSLLALDAGAARSLHEDATRSACTPEQDFHACLGLEDEDGKRLGEEIERIWSNDGARGAREVRVKLCETLLPGVWLKIAMHAGELLVEMSSASAGTRHWLTRVASRLANDVCMRLRQSVRVVVLDPDAHQSGFALAHWNGDERL